MADATSIDESDRLAGGPSSLPMPPMSFLGRQDDLARVCGLIDNPEVRVLTLTGVGGVGKTRLALEIARRVAQDFADGVRYVSLAQLTDTTSVMPAVAREMGIRGPADPDPLDAVLRALRDRHLLLVLDNYEHLLGEPPTWFTAVIGSSPRLKILVTSRVPLNIDGEQRYIVPPFDVPDADAPTRLQDNTAVALFCQRARTVNPNFVIDDANMPAISEICRRLDGLALAVELAAARTAVFTPEQILARLSDRLALLSVGRRDSHDRHRSIRDAIAWSYDLLTAEAQSVFRRVSVFVGGASLDAIASVTMPDREDDSGAVELVSELIEHSLLRPVAGGDVEPRYAMLETIREFGNERLQALGEDRDARDAHAAWCASLARAGSLSLQGPDQVSWLERLDREQPNLRAAIDWLIGEDRAEDAIAMAWDLRWFWGLRGYDADAETIFARLDGHPRLQEPTIHRGKLLGKLGGLAFMRGQQDRAERLLHEAIGLLHAHGARVVEVDAHMQLALVLRATGALDASSASLARARRIGQDLGDASTIAATAGNLGLNALLAGDREAGEALLEEALRMSEEAGDTWLIALQSLYLGHLALECGDDARAERLLESSQTIFQMMGNMLDQPKVALYLAELSERRGDLKGARQRLGEGLAAARVTRETDFIARCHLGLGSVSLQLGDRAAAGGHLLDALQLYRELGSGFGIAACIELVAALAADAGDACRGARVLAAATEMPRTGATTWLIGSPAREAGDTRSRLIRALGDHDFAECWEAGLALSPAAAAIETEALARAIIEHQARAHARTPFEKSALSSRELDVLRLLSDGLSNQEIADALFVSRRTVASHVEHILTKLDLRSRTAAVAYAIRSGIA